MATEIKNPPKYGISLDVNATKIHLVLEAQDRGGPLYHTPYVKGHLQTNSPLEAKWTCRGHSYCVFLFNDVREVPMRIDLSRFSFCRTCFPAGSGFDILTDDLTTDKRITNHLGVAICKLCAIHGELGIPERVVGNIPLCKKCGAIVEKIIEHYGVEVNC